MTLADIAFVRDWVIIVVGSLASVLLLLMILFTVVIGIATRMLIGSARHLLETEVTPLAQSARQTVVRVKGTVQFVGETAVTPVVRVYGAVAGARKAAGVLTGISRRSNPRGRR